MIKILSAAILYIIIITCGVASTKDTIYGVGDVENDLFIWLKSEGFDLEIYSDLGKAVNEIPASAVLLILADHYPEERVAVKQGMMEMIEEKNIRFYLEYPSMFPGRNLSQEAIRTRLERGVIVSEEFGKALSPMSILGINDCHIIPMTHDQPMVVLAKVAGLDEAAYGLADVPVYPLLVKEGEGFLSLTKLSDFAKGRYGPEDHWQTLWGFIIGELTGEKNFEYEAWPRYLSPSFSREDSLTQNDKTESVKKGVEWFSKGRFYIHPDWESRWLKYQGDGTDPVGPPVPLTYPNGDGTLGLLEGHSSNIYHDGSQQYRYWIRADVQGEAAFALAAAGDLLEETNYFDRAENLIDFIFSEKLRSGPRNHPDSAAFGLIGWSHTHPGVYYGDDNARAILGILGASAHLETEQWDKEMVEAILANFRTTGQSGFRGNRPENKDLQRLGWRHFHNRSVTNPAPHFESWMWALYLWLYDKTGYTPVLERTKLAIQTTMESYPDDWLWTNGIQQERARMILPLAWLVRVEDTPQHREWLDRVVMALLENQMESGAIREELGGADKGRYGKTRSNAEYGLHEAPLIFENGDPVSDMLYTSNFAFFSLNEAAHATGDERYLKALEKLSGFLTRIQVESEHFEDLDGAWFRAFDYERWEFWASNADVGWGAWGTLTGWTQSWIVATQVLVINKQSYWELTGQTKIKTQFDQTLDTMLKELK